MEFNGNYARHVNFNGQAVKKIMYNGVVAGCPPVYPSMLENEEFGCGTMGWTYNPQYPSEITDNGDGSIHLKANTTFGSVSPVNVPTEDASYHIEVSVRNQVGASPGKISFQRPNGSWHTVEFSSMDDGVYTSDYAGVIRRIDIGANNDTSFECDFDYIKLTKV
jgi:hypothetical protein